jgi:hypothetical protein
MGHVLPGLTRDDDHPDLEPDQPADQPALQPEGDRA